MRYMKLFIIAALLIVQSAVYAGEAENYRNSIFGDGGLKKSGEAFCDVCGYYMGAFVNNYEATKDASWLEEGIKYYDFAISKLSIGPDGYKGWIGPYVYDNTVWTDVCNGDSGLITDMLLFSEIVLKDPALKAKYGTKALGYIELAKKHLIEKWDKRESWIKDGPYGFYMVNPKYFMDPAKKKWVSKKALMGSIPFNKQHNMGWCFLALWRITKDPEYKDRALRMFSLTKSRLRWEEDRYFINYWEPFALWDMSARPKSWVGVHDERSGYNAFDIASIVEAYHSGFVFTEDDIKKLINTNLWMWNKSMSVPHFVSSSGKAVKSSWTGADSGTLWTSLAWFDPKIREIMAVMVKDETGKRYYKNVVCKEPPSFKRKYVSDPKEIFIPDIKLYPSKEFIFTGVLPCHIKVGSSEKMKICVLGEVDGKYSADIYSNDSKTKVVSLESKDLKEYEALTINITGEDSRIAKLKGNYRVRWTCGKGFKEMPVIFE